MASLKGSERRNAFLMIALGTLLVIVPLAATSYTTGKAGSVQFHTTQATEEWLADAEAYELISVKSSGDTVEVRITGYGDLPASEALVADIADRMKDQLTVELEVIPAQFQSLSVNQP